MGILVTGGAGFIGSHLIRLLLAQQDQQILNFDALRYSANLENLSDVESHPRYTFMQGDICIPSDVDRAFRDVTIDVVINCAAENHVDRSLLDPINFVKTDVLGTAVLLEASRKAGVQRFLQVSTDEVYGSLEAGCSREQEVLRPRSPYSASKAGGDLLALSYWTSYNFPVVVTRGTNTYGSHQYPEKLIPLTITNALEDRLIPLYGDGRNRRDWLSVSDHCQALLTVVKKGVPGHIYNVGAGNERENLSVVRRILEQLGKPDSLVKFVQDRPGHDRRYAVDSSAVTALGWKPTVVFEEGLKETVEWYRTHREWWKSTKSEKFLEYYKKMYEDRLSAEESEEE